MDYSNRPTMTDIIREAIDEAKKKKKPKRQKHETILKRKILDYLNAIQIMAWRVNTGGVAYGSGKQASYGGSVEELRYVKFGIPGQADITGVLPGGRRLEIEVKSPTGRQSSDQKAFQAKVELHGAVYILADDFDTFKTELSTILSHLR